MNALMDAYRKVKATPCSQEKPYDRELVMFGCCGIHVGILARGNGWCPLCLDINTSIW